MVGDHAFVGELRARSYGRRASIVAPALGRDKLPFRKLKSVPKALRKLGVALNTAIVLMSQHACMDRDASQREHRDLSDDRTYVISSRHSKTSEDGLTTITGDCRFSAEW